MPQAVLKTQLAFVQKLKELAPANASLADEMAELLDVSSDSAYRRLRGETAITLDEAVILANHFKIPFSAFTENLEGLVTFRYKHMTDDSDSFYKYLYGLDQTLDKLLLANDKKMVYGATDIPILNHLGYREIGSFKMYHWMRSLMGAKSLEDKKFSPGVIPGEMQKVAHSIYKKYKKLPSVEIWSDDLLFPTLKQIEYNWDASLFESRESALAVCEDLRKMLRDTCEMAVKGSKQTDEPASQQSQNFQLYFSELLIGNNSIMVWADGLKLVFLSHHTFNNINTTDERFCAETEDWINKHLKKATLISGTAEKQRNKFFNSLEKNIDKTIARIMAD
ncbi:MAG TPA: hypothetical protein VEC12_11390 [Bacteroidia bacterium]|nr:hypothetical protein [Bacteroidia bacterium]